MIPIGIVTCNRAQFLDITLRSLLATDLPKDQKVVIFDDATNDTLTYRYLYTNEEVDLSTDWPIGKEWINAGLGVIKSRKTTGIKDIVPVIRLGDERQYVVNASCSAIRMLYKMYNSEQIILIQDDIVFNYDWLDRLCNTVKVEKSPPTGLIIGMSINNSNRDGKKDVLVSRHYYTAQCFFITNRGKKIIDEFINSQHSISTEFDNAFVRVVRRKGAGVYLINPPVCQHFGFLSQVRPGKRGWLRIDWASKGPYVMADDVRNMMSIMTDKL